MILERVDIIGIFIHAMFVEYCSAIARSWDSSFVKKHDDLDTQELPIRQGILKSLPHPKATPRGLSHYVHVDLKNIQVLA